MSEADLGRADLRFLLPTQVASATLLGADPAWEEALAGFGVEVGGERQAVQLVVAGPGSIAEARDSGAAAVIVEGADARRALTAAGYGAQAMLAVPSIGAPAAFVPLGDRGAANYCLRTWLAPGERWKVARNRVAAMAIAAGIAPRRRDVVTVAARDTGRPQLVREATRLGVPGDVRSVLLPGQGDRLARGLIMLFERGSDEPSWALKFARVAGYAEQFDRDERGYDVVRIAGEVARAQAPEPLGRIVASGVHAAVETAAVGQPLIAFLGSSANRRDKLEAIERIARWLVELGRTSRADPGALADERERLATTVVPAWENGAALGDLLPPLRRVPAVAAHNDLGSWNLVVSRDDFRALDWEAARRHGLPLWDLWYMLGDSLAHVDGVPAGSSRAAYLASLFRGEARSSGLLFLWTRRMVEALAIPVDAVGPLATLCWMHHGLSGAARAEALRSTHGDDSGRHDVMAELARRWLTDRTLGDRWASWQGPA